MDLTDSDDDLDIMQSVKKELGHEDYIKSNLSAAFSGAPVDVLYLQGLSAMTPRIVQEQKTTNMLSLVDVRTKSIPKVRRLNGQTTMQPTRISRSGRPLTGRKQRPVHARPRR